MDEHHYAVLADSVSVAVKESSGGRILLNFDSHDDWGISCNVKKRRKKRKGDDEEGTVTAEEVLMRQYLEEQNAKALEFMEIGTWIMPLVALGAYDHLVWVTKWANIPRETFSCSVGYVDNGSRILVTGEDVPEIWRSIWGDAYAVEHPSKGQSTKKDVMITVVDSSEAARYVSAHPGGDWTVSVDLDFFTAANPGKEGLPQLIGDRSLKLDMWTLATAVPIEHGNVVFEALHSYYTGGSTVVEATATVVDCAVGTDWQEGGCKAFNRSQVDSLLRRSYGKVSMQWLTMLISSSHLADHRATDAELEQLLSEFERCMHALMDKSQPPAEVLIARSEDYRHRGYYMRKQAQDVRDRVVAFCESL